MLGNSGVETLRIEYELDTWLKEEANTRKILELLQMFPPSKVWRKNFL